jgi:RNA polymerase sigma-70 factor (sigma-E family)
MDYDRFFLDHYDDVVRTLALVAGDRERAEDAAQEAFAKAYRRWPDVSAMERPAGWVVVVATNRLRRWITRHDRRFRAAGDRDATAAPPPDHADAVASAAALRGALGALAPRQRAVVVLRYLCDLPTAEVAEALGVSQGTVKSALHRGLANLRLQMDDEPIESDEVANDANR